MMRAYKFVIMILALACGSSLYAIADAGMNKDKEYVYSRMRELNADNAADFYSPDDDDFFKIAPSGKLSRMQAAFDLMALVYNLNEIHPNIYSECSQSDFMSAVNEVGNSLPDSISVVDLFQRVAPIVAMIGDGHTSLQLPYNRILTKKTKRLPLSGTVNNKRVFLCKVSLDSLIPTGARVVKINGIEMMEMIDSMLNFVSGEREHFKLAQISRDFQGLYEILYHADEYVVEFIPENSAEVSVVTLPAVTESEMNNRLQNMQRSRRRDDYSYSVDSTNNVAIMEFNRFHDPKRMAQFADSMFNELREQRITNLIIDIRNNGGGNTNVGDVLLSYISNEPFTQFEKTLIKMTPASLKLLKKGSGLPGLTLIDKEELSFINPRTNEEGHYDGNVYLLISNYTFSSAADFAWTFKVCDMGTVIGEESGGMNVCFGDVLTYTLPISKLKCGISYKRFWGYKADEKEIHGTIPDINVPVENALDAAMKLIKR